MPTERTGNALLKSAQCSWRNGISPGGATFVYNEEVHVPVGLYQRIQLGDLTWTGIVEGAPTAMNETVGKITTVTGVDLTDDLQRAVCFARFNSRDDTGRLYCIMPEDWDMQTRTYQGTSMWGIVFGLAFAAGFGVAFSPYAAINLRIGSATRFNDSSPPSPCAWDLDWNDGQKVGTALLEICDQLGLQFTTAHSRDSSVLYFSMKGEFDSGGILFAGYQGDMATEGTWGKHLNRAVDTKIDIIGQEAIHEVQNITLKEGWDTRKGGIWEEWAVDYNKFVNDLKKEGLDQYTATVQQVTQSIIGSSTVIPAIHNNEPVGSMLARDYIDMFPFRYWTLPAFTGSKYIRSGGSGLFGLMVYGATNFYPAPPLADHLVTEPDLESIVKVRTIIVTNDIMDGSGTYPVEEVERVLTTGYTLDRMTGGFMFEDQCFRVDANNEPVLVAPVATVAFHGPRFRRTYGWGDRRGVVPMASLRKLYLHNYASWNQRGTERPLYEGVRTASSLKAHFDAIKAGNFFPGATTTTWKTADMAAAEIAAVKLAQQNIIAAGQRTWKGMCGHLPGGWIQQVNVTVDEDSGLTETVDISNEMSFGDASIDEINDRIIQYRRDMLKASKDNRDTETKIREARLNAAAAKRLFGLETEVEGGNDLATKAGRSFAPDGTVPVVLKTDKTAGDTVEAGGESGYESFRETVGGSFYGIVLNDVEASEADEVTARCVVHGPVMAKVKGPVEAGDAVGMSPDGAYLSADAAVMCGQVLLAETSETPTLLPVLMGGGAGGNTTKACTVTTDYANGTYDVEDVSGCGSWTNSDPIRVFENNTETLKNTDFFMGQGVGQRVMVMLIQGEWQIVTGHARMM